MYLKRKIDAYLDNWFNSECKTPLLITGIRQCGKTESVREFAKRNKLNLIELNFWNNKNLSSDFEDSLNVDSIISNLSIRFPNLNFEHKNTLLFFDEIQECPKAKLSFKNFEKDGRYIVIGSGSYLGINGYIIGDSTPAPTGYDQIYEMMTLDFEEFLWALNYKEEQINYLLDSFKNKTPIKENIHNIFKQIFNDYICIGGFPKVVKEYINTKKIIPAYTILNNTVFDMKTDFGRRKDSKGNPLFKPNEVSRIQQAFDLIPTFLSKENKRYITNKITGGNGIQKADAIEYLTQAHIVYKVNNLECLSLPLSGQKISSQFKLFPEDIGIVTSMFGVDTIKAIHSNDLGQGKGAIYEAIVSESLLKAGVKPYYFAKNSGLEIDFVISYNGFPTLLEVKARNGNAKSSKTILKHPEHYGKVKLLKIGDYNISEKDDVITIPHYLTFALGKTEYDF